MKNSEPRLQDKLYSLQVQPPLQSAHYFGRLFSEPWGDNWQKHSKRRRPLRIIYELDVLALPTLLERYSIRHILRQFVDSGHKVDIVVYDHIWYGNADLTSAIMDTFVASLQAISSSNITVHAASDLRKTIDVDTLYASLEMFLLKDMIGSGKGMEKKNSSRSMQDILRQGFSLALWQQLKADVVLTCGPAFFKSHADIAFLEIPRLSEAQGVNSTQGATESQLLFEAVVNIPDQDLTDVYCYMVVTDDAHHGDLAAMLTAQPLETKKQLATVLAAMHFGGLEEGIKVRQAFEAVIAGQSLDDYLPVAFLPGMTLFDALASTDLYSRSELRRLFAGGAVRNIADPTLPLQPDHRDIKHNDVIRIGKKYRLRMCV